MPISDVASLIGGAALGAPVSEILKLVIEEAKKVNDFKSLSQDLASTMETLIPVIKDIDSMQQRSNPGRGELIKVLFLLQGADVMVRKCSSVQWYNILKRALYTRKIKVINQQLLRFCQIELPLIQYRDHLHSMHLMANMRTQVLTLDNGLPFATNPPCSISDGCSFTVEHGRSVNPCHKSIAIHEVENHVSNPNCYVCKEEIPSTAEGIKYSQHPFWGERYCHVHDTDGTPKCCSCEQLEPKGTDFVKLGDGRLLCLECRDSAVMDSDECQLFYFDMREFFEGLHMKIEKEFPFLLVEKQTLNKAEKEEKINKQDNEYDEVMTRDICCLSEAQTVRSVSKGPRMGPNMRLIGIDTESHVVRECEVIGA